MRSRRSAPVLRCRFGRVGDVGLLGREQRCQSGGVEQPARPEGGLALNVVGRAGARPPAVEEAGVARRSPRVCPGQFLRNTSASPPSRSPIPRDRAQTCAAAGGRARRSRRGASGRIRSTWGCGIPGLARRCGGSRSSRPGRSRYNGGATPPASRFARHGGRPRAASCRSRGRRHR